VIPRFREFDPVGRKEPDEDQGNIGKIGRVSGRSHGKVEVASIE
jgi:hypothetical protein